jgi:hypothetical protein
MERMGRNRRSGSYRHSVRILSLYEGREHDKRRSLQSHKPAKPGQPSRKGPGSQKVLWIHRPLKRDGRGNRRATPEPNRQVRILPRAKKQHANGIPDERAGFDEFPNDCLQPKKHNETPERRRSRRNFVQLNPWRNQEKSTLLYGLESQSAFIFSSKIPA